ncbi:unnamed protein product, partial [Brassica rapa subsp. trilocularis]
WSRFSVLGNGVTQSFVLSEWSTEEASFVAGLRLTSEAWSLVKLFWSGLHCYGVDVLVHALNSYLMVTSACV